MVTDMAHKKRGRGLNSAVEYEMLAEVGRCKPFIESLLERLLFGGVKTDLE